MEELLKAGKHTVTALSRADSTSQLPSGVEVRKVNYDDQSSLVKALRGQEALIITMGARAPQDQQTKLIEAAAAANVPWVLPNEFGNDPLDTELNKDNMIGLGKAKYRDHIEQLGKSSWIALTCNFWYEFSLGGGSERYGFDLKNHQVVFFDKGDKIINTTTWPQCGRAIANLLSLKVLRDDENDKSSCLTDFKNKPLYISSFTVSQRDMLDSVIRVTGTKLEDWKITHESAEKRWKSGVEQLKNGDMTGFVIALYTRLFFPDTSGNYEATKGLDNDAIGLPKEDLDEYTKLAIAFSE